MSDVQPGLELANVFVASKINALKELRYKTTDLRALSSLDTAIMALEHVSGRIVRAIGPSQAE